MDALQPVIRLFFLVVIAMLYLETRDRVFLMVFGVVAVGFVLTAVSHVFERRQPAR